MPKPPPVEYFECVCRMPVLTAGPIMAMLTKIEGLDVSAPHLVSEVKTFSKNERTNHTVKAEDFLAAWMKDHPTFRAKEAIAAFRADGRTSGAGYTALRVMSGDGRLKKLGEGMYSLPGVKHLAAPKKAKKKATKVYHDISASDFTLRLMSRSHGKISSATLKKHFEEAGRVPTGTGPVLNKLRVNGMVKSLGEGMYELTARAKGKPASKPKSNGAAAVTDTAPGV